MQFVPEKYALPDVPMQPFIDAAEIEQYLLSARGDTACVQEVVRKSLAKGRLSLPEVAVLLKADSPAAVQLIKDAAQTLKSAVYGNRIVLFAPLYVGNYCVNDCTYCGFRATNSEAVRVTLDRRQLIREVEALEEQGQKRLILVFGEHPAYSPEYIAEAVRTVYAVKHGAGEIRRVNINAAPLDIDGFRTVKAAGIGTYQIFQESYHRESYKRCHPRGPKQAYDNRLTALDRALEAGLDDVGIGALFGLYDWRFEVMALVRHANHLEACYNIGPHTISFPRLQAASHGDTGGAFAVPDEAFTRLVAILRLAVPYTGLICTAREGGAVRREVLRYGVSQIDGGTRLELGSYADMHSGGVQNLHREQFRLNDARSLAAIVDELLDDGLIPSFCTACYRKGRTGEHFMEFSVPGFIKRFCTPNAVFTLAEYLEDYAGDALRQKGYAVIENILAADADNALADDIGHRLQRIRNGARDVFY
ncbi:MAG: [FeFe] hydrogenase H-cluster radical SAM maturase HydG [Prevotellaceae bacterium]|jgi:2-iminoacetate synthase|nr:[FeFe] hydrogenase H-cluster radical SAM maturase HydG [Prevotellaceae bacterium]